MRKKQNQENKANFTEQTDIYIFNVPETKICLEIYGIRHTLMPNCSKVNISFFYDGIKIGELTWYAWQNGRSYEDFPIERFEEDFKIFPELITFVEIRKGVYYIDERIFGSSTGYSLADGKLMELDLFSAVDTAFI